MKVEEISQLDVDISRFDGEEEEMAEAQGFDATADQQFPNRPKELDDVELVPVEVGPPQYGSPEGEGLANSLIPNPDEPMLTVSSVEPEGAAVAPKDRKAKDWKELVDNAADEQALDAVEQDYEDSGADFSTVQDALKAKREGFAAQSENDNS